MVKLKSLLKESAELYLADNTDVQKLVGKSIKGIIAKDTYFVIDCSDGTRLKVAASNYSDLDYFKSK